MRSAPVSGLSIALRSSLEGTATFRTPSRHTLPARFASADALSHASDSASTDPSRNRSRSPAARFYGLRPRRRRQPSPPPRWWSRRQVMAALGALRAVRSTRRAACCAAVAPGAAVSRRWLPEAAQRLREGSGLASQPPQAGQMAGGRLAGLRGTLRTLRPMAPVAPLNLLLYARAHAVVYTVVL